MEFETSQEKILDRIGHLDKSLKQAETVTLYKCDKCKKIIYNGKDGFLILGNIYTAEPDNLGGLIGNNFPEGSFTINDINKVVYCRECFTYALNAEKETASTSYPSTSIVDRYPRRDNPRYKSRTRY